MNSVFYVIIIFTKGNLPKKDSTFQLSFSSLIETSLSPRTYALATSHVG